MADEIEVQLNGDWRTIPDGLSVQELLEYLELEGGRIAVEVNRKIVRQADWSNWKIGVNDEIEIVHFVGGGTGE